MQNVTGPPRDALTAAAVTRLIRGAPAIVVGCGVESIALDLTATEDLSASLLGGSVERHAYNTLHGQASLQITRELDFGSAILRPYLTLTDGITLARFNLGAYYPATPDRPFGEIPPTYTVACYDILQVLDDLVGDAYSIDAGTSYLQAVTDILDGRGVLVYSVDQAAAGKVLPTARTWPLDDQTTWLSIVNDLLASIGYQGIWSDWDGRLVVQQYQTPATRSSEWTYTADAVAIHGPDGTVSHDYYAAPNRWVAYRSNNVDSTPPVEGDGIFTVTNAATGPTSIAGRGGRVITRPLPIDVADQASLIAAALISIDADMQIGTKVTTASGPNPLHWHFDRITVNDAAIGAPAEYLSTDWTMALDLGAMAHTWVAL